MPMAACPGARPGSCRSHWRESERFGVGRGASRSSPTSSWAGATRAGSEPLMGALPFASGAGPRRWVAGTNVLFNDFTPERTANRIVEATMYTADERETFGISVSRTLLDAAGWRTLLALVQAMAHPTD